MPEELAALRPDGLMRPPQDNKPNIPEGEGIQSEDLPFQQTPSFRASSGDFVKAGDGSYEVLGHKFSRRTPPRVVARASFLTQLDAQRGRTIELHEGDAAYSEDRVPTQDETFATITKKTAEYIRDVALVYERGGHVLLEGPTGCGKTTLAKTVCRLANRNAVELTFSGDTKTKDFMWHDVLVDTVDWQSGEKKKSVIKIPGPFLDAMVNGDTLIVNEGNMMASDLQSLFFQVMDTGQILFSDIDQLRTYYRDKLPAKIPAIPVLEARKGFQIVVSINPGYIGTESVNKAWERRFKRQGGLIEMGYLPEEEEIQAVTSELQQRNERFGHEVEASPEMARCFVTAAHSLRNGIVTYTEGDPPQVKQRVDKALKQKFQELISTRTIIYWIENYMMNSINATGAAERTFLINLDRRDRRDMELKQRALDVINIQVDQLIGGELAFLEGLEKPSFNQEITVPWQDRKAADTREVLIKGQPREEELFDETSPRKSQEQLLQEADGIMDRYLRFSAAAYAHRAQETGRITPEAASQAKQLIAELANNGLEGEQAEINKQRLKDALQLGSENYDQFLGRVEALYKRVLRRKGLLKDALPLKDVDIPAFEHVLPVVTESSLTNLQIIDNAVARGKIVKLRGPTGAGKSTLARTWAYLRGRRLVEHPFSGETKLSDFGYKTTLREGETSISIQFLYKAMERGYTVLINEFNMAWPEVVTAFNNVADKGRKIRLPDGREIKIHPEFALFYTENPPDLRHARSAQYAGAKPQNQAVENRCGVNMWVDYPPEDEETAILRYMNPHLTESFAKNLVSFVGDVRAAMDSATITDVTKEALRRFSMSTDELMQLVKRNYTDKEVVLELTRSFNSLADEQKRQIAPHMVKLMPLLESR